MKALKHSMIAVSSQGMISAFLAGMPIALSAGSLEAPPLKAGLERDGSFYVVEIANVSGQTLQLTPLELGGADFSGLSLYLYNPSNGTLGEAMATVFPGPPGPAPKRTAVLPRRALLARFSRDEVARYLAPLPKCYYLVAVYHEVQSDRRVWSSPSNAIYECS